MAVNDKISQSEYNAIRNKLVGILSTGSANSGWGQPVVSSAVGISNKVTVNEWANLGYDITNAYRHITGSSPTLAAVAEGATVKYNATFTPATTDSPVTQYDTWANYIIANQYTVAGTQSYTTNKGTGSTTWPGLYGSSWSTSIKCTVTVSFSNATQARYFFNSGGEIRLLASQTGGSGIPQNTSWRSLLSSAGSRSFGAVIPASLVDPNDGQNFYRCSNSYAVWYSTSASSPYSSNTYKISARTPDVVDNSTGTASTLQFLVEWVDNHTGIAGGPDYVDGTFNLNVSTLTATGTLVPAAAGSFVVENPTVTIGAITT